MKRIEKFFYDDCFKKAFILAALNILFFILFFFVTVKSSFSYKTIYGDMSSVTGKFKMHYAFPATEKILFFFTTSFCVISAFGRKKNLFGISAVLDLATVIVFNVEVNKSLSSTSKATISRNSFFIVLYTILLIITFIYHLIYTFTYERKEYVENEKNLKGKDDWKNNIWPIC